MPRKPVKHVFVVKCVSSVKLNIQTSLVKIWVHTQFIINVMTLQYHCGNSLDNIHSWSWTSCFIIRIQFNRRMCEDYVPGTFPSNCTVIAKAFVQLKCLTVHAMAWTVFYLSPPDLGQFISDSLLFLGFKVQFPAERNILITHFVHPPTRLPVSASPIARRSIESKFLACCWRDASLLNPFSV